MSGEFLEDKPQATDQTPVIKARGWGMLAGTFWAIVAFLGPQFAIVPLLPVIAGLSLAQNVKLFTFRVLVELVTVAILFTVIYAYGLNQKSIGLSKVRPQSMGLVFIVLPIYFALSAFIAFISAKFLPQPLLEQQQNIGFTSGNGLELALIFIALVLVTPFVEEVIFRGFLLRAYRQKLPNVPAALIVSGLFAVAHAQINVGIDVFILSLALCYVRIKSDSLWPSIMLHSLKNFVAFFLLFIIGVK